MAFSAGVVDSADFSIADDFSAVDFSTFAASGSVCGWVFDSVAAVSLSDFFAGSVFLAGGRREFVGRVERRGGRVVVVRAVVGFDFAVSGLEIGRAHV